MRDGRSILHYPSARTDWSRHSIAVAQHWYRWARRVAAGAAAGSAGPIWPVWRPAWLRFCCPMRPASFAN